MIKLGVASNCSY